MESVIALAGANRNQSTVEDGFLTGLEVEGLHLNGTKLVVLSSCEAGQVLPVDGAGLVGIRTAFAIAGAKGIVTNLWKADDSKSLLFMRDFYSRLDLAGPAEALRLAQLTMSRDKDSAFEDWAGYQYAGISKPLHPTADSAPPTADQSSLVSPHCIEVSARGERDGHKQTTGSVRINLGALAHSLASSEYEMLAANAEYVWGTTGEGKSLIPLLQDVANAPYWHTTLAVERHPDWSGLTITMKKMYSPEPAFRQAAIPATTDIVIKLRGAPGLFPTPAFPQELPELSSFHQGTIWTQDVGLETQELTIDSVNPCSMSAISP